MHEAGSEKEPGLELGETLQRALEARGIEIGLEETARLSAALLSLVRQGLIEPVEQKAEELDRRAP